MPSIIRRNPMPRATSGLRLPYLASLLLLLTAGLALGALGCADKEPLPTVHAAPTATPLAANEREVIHPPLSRDEELARQASRYEQQISQLKADYERQLAEARKDIDTQIKAQADKDAAKLAQARKSTAKAEAALAACRNSYASLLPPDYVNRVDDLIAINKALAAYKRDHGSYPVMEQWAGLASLWGPSTRDWIPGLTPNYMSVLPGDPRHNSNPEEQYIYRSDGTDYKLLSHHPGNCSALKADHPDMVDPVRDCGAMGFWTSGAANW